ncbi:hypothetical protein [Nocardioides bizhenqiangii]|uniref:Uncharacterized protein n=1 Tax=Nocardioides bizhenqiangii TaxID=3095076 RepID=A0ABZ0ZJW6_9ACTN|nr:MULTISPECIES: hypothetical protein [unclassified Nocardioides]MDZ5620372.1 hypothetical protein [Nocardioides sp. HM23]WQQ24742.1 hypothetical protein SHK19_12270 [Nocardioides sp. HM61]
MREPHENVATVLVDPRALADLELELMELDLRVWPVATAPICVDGERTAFQLRRSLVMRQRGAWDVAAEWTPVWISFGGSWYDGAEPLPWAAHQTLWRALEVHGDHVRYQRRLGGVPPLQVPVEVDG